MTNTPNQYVCFRKEFSLPGDSRHATAIIAVDSDYVLYVNGAEVARGQFSDYPTEKTYTTVALDGVLQAGRNTLAVLAYYRGEDFSTYRAGKPGFIGAVTAGETVIVTDASWRVRQSPAFTSGDVPKVTGQLAYTVAYDARHDDAWMTPGYDDRAWPSACVLAGATDGYWTSLTPRPVPSLRIEPAVPVCLAAQGRFIRIREGVAVAETMATDALITYPLHELLTGPAPADAAYTHQPSHPADGLRLPDGRWVALQPPGDGTTGTFLILDCGRQETGLLILQLDAPAGTIVDIAHGEHLDDGRVRMAVGGRHFTDRYICRDGEQCFTLPFRRLGARYLQVHLSAFQRPVRVNYLGLQPACLPVEQAGHFATNDPLANRMYAVGTRTLQLCMHEHYEDCPWREQALYAGDARNQALYGYYAFGNYDFAATSFDLLGRGIRDDGLLELCAPARVPVTIPCYSLQWITALAEHWLYSGSGALFARFDAQIADMLDVVVRRFDRDTGLYRVPISDEIWNLYDWMDGLAGSEASTDTRWEAPYNLFLHEALGSYAWMLRHAGRHAQADAITRQQKALGTAIYRAFWREPEAACTSFAGTDVPPHFTELVQMQALYQGLIPDSALPRALDNLFARRWHPLTFYTMLYQALALRTRGPAARADMAETVARCWEPMLFAGATSFWETGRGGDDFDRAGSLCHGWSALPVYYYQAWVLGVHPLEPGFRRFTLSPYPDRYYTATGQIPTPAGSIHLAWQRLSDGLHLDVTGPETLTPVVMEYPEAPVASAYYNGRLLAIGAQVPCTLSVTDHRRES